MQNFCKKITRKEREMHRGSMKKFFIIRLNALKVFRQERLPVGIKIGARHFSTTKLKIKPFFGIIFQS